MDAENPLSNSAAQGVVQQDPGNPRYRWVMKMYGFLLIFSKWYSPNWYYELGSELKRVLTKHWSNV
jgi:hypothetical protein